MGRFIRRIDKKGIGVTELMGISSELQDTGGAGAGASPKADMGLPRRPLHTLWPCWSSMAWLCVAAPGGSTPCCLAERSLKGLLVGLWRPALLGVRRGLPRALCQATPGDVGEAAQGCARSALCWRPQEKGHCALRGLNTEIGRETLL